MHMHVIMFAVMHFTVLAIVGYLLLFSAGKAEGIVALIGRLLGIWVFILAILGTGAMIFLHGHGPMDGPGPWMHHMGPPPGGPGMPPPPPPKP